MKKYRDKDFVDDGRTIANMDLVGMPWSKHGRSSRKKQRTPESGPIDKMVFTPKERRAIVMGALAMIVPIVVGFVAILAVVLLFLDLFWLR